MLQSAQAGFQRILDSMRGILGCVSLIGLGVGCWWILPALGLIVPSAIVLAMLTYSEIRAISRDSAAS